MEGINFMQYVEKSRNEYLELRSQLQEMATEYQRLKKQRRATEGTGVQAGEKWREMFKKARGKVDGEIRQLQTDEHAMKAEAQQLDELITELEPQLETLKVKTVQQLNIKANHTLPVGLIDSMTFLEALAMDLMAVRIKELSDTTGWIVVKSCDGLKSEAITERNQSGSVIDRAMNSLDPYCVVVLNGEEVGRTHALSHTGENPEWNERIGFPMQLLRSTKNTFTMEVMDMDVGRDDLLGTATVSVNGKTNFAEVEKLTDYPLVPDPKAKRKDAVLGASIQMQIVPPRASLQSTVKKVKTGLSSVRDLSGFIGAKAGSSKDTAEREEEA